MTVDEKFTEKEKWAIAGAVIRVGRQLAVSTKRNESDVEAFVNVYTAVHFQSGCGDDCRSKDKNGKAYGNEGGAFASGWQSNEGYFLIKVGTMVDDGGFGGMVHIVHELGHIYDAAKESMSLTMSSDVYTRNSLRPNGYWYNGKFTEQDDVLLWQMHPISMSNGGSRSETFADIFVAWAFDAWNTSTDKANVDAVKAAQDWMP